MHILNTTIYDIFYIQFYLKESYNINLTKQIHRKNQKF